MDRQQQAAFLGEVHDRSSLLLDAYVTLIENYDADEDFAAIVTQAQKAGLGKEELLAAFPCSWSTILRWAAGQVRPARVARPAIKDKLIAMLRHKGSEHRVEARQLEAA